MPQTQIPFHPSLRDGQPYPVTMSVDFGRQAPYRCHQVKVTSYGIEGSLSPAVEILIKSRHRDTDRTRPHGNRGRDWVHIYSQPQITIDFGSPWKPGKMMEQTSTEPRRNRSCLNLGSRPPHSRTMEEKQLPVAQSHPGCGNVSHGPRNLDSLGRPGGPRLESLLSTSLREELPPSSLLTKA